MIEAIATSLRFNDLLTEFLGLSNLLDFNPAALVLSDEHVVKFLFLLNRLEVVDDDADEQVNDELAADDHENHIERDCNQLIAL